MIPIPSVPWDEMRKKLSKVGALVVPEELLRRIRTYVSSQLPVEACGFLLGKFDGTEALVERVIFVKNVYESPDRFMLDPRECSRVFEAAQADQEVVGFFHSHAKDPRPSGLDQASMRILSLVWLIVGGTEKGVTNHRECVAVKSSRERTKRVEVKVAETKLVGSGRSTTRAS